MNTGVIVASSFKLKFRIQWDFLFECIDLFLISAFYLFCPYATAENSLVLSTSSTLTCAHNYKQRLTAEVYAGIAYTTFLHRSVEGGLLNHRMAERVAVCYPAYI